MIEFGHGNLLTQDVDALVNTVNTVGVMGKGIALQFKRAFPANYKAYRSAAMRDEIRLGEMFVFDSGLVGPRRYIVNFPTKGHWRSPSRIEDIESGLTDLVHRLPDLNVTSLAMPALGCGNGGLDWSEVRPMIEQAFGSVPEIRVVVFPPAGAPPPETMPVATPRPSMTSNRATLLTAMASYLKSARTLDVREGVSELEVQKLAYFLQVLGQPSDLTFARGRYGPYAERLHHVLQQLEGHLISGYGDRSAPVTELRPINLVEGVLDEAGTWLTSNGDGELERVEALMALTDGFATPYSLELLATAHFAARQAPPTNDLVDIADRVTDWNLRKARLFTARHVELAGRHLREHNLLPEMGYASSRADRT